MAEEGISQEFWSKEVDKRRNYFTEEIRQNELISKKYKNVCKYLNYIERLLVIASTVTGFVSISAPASLVGIPGGIASSAVTIQIYVITAGIKKYKSIIKKKKKKHDKRVLLAKTKLNTIVVLISKALVDFNISHDEFVSVNDSLKEYYDMKEWSLM